MSTLSEWNGSADNVANYTLNENVPTDTEGMDTEGMGIEEYRGLFSLQKLGTEGTSIPSVYFPWEYT